MNSRTVSSLPRVLTMDVEFPNIHRELIRELPTRSETGQLEINEIKRIDKPISYEEFFKSYLLKNVPCILSSSFTQAWRSRREWVTEDGTPNFALLGSLFGQATVPVANCGREEFCSHPKTDMKMSDYLSYWQEGRASGHDLKQPCLYLKDWHFSRDFPDYHAYTTLPFFCSDWLNEFWETREDQPADDYKFVYMGPKDSWTPFHADVFRSYSWSANICGKKKWIFFPPGTDKHLQDRHGNLVYDIRSEKLEDESLYPSAAQALPKRLEVIQNQGETIFVPSNWHHQVHNLEDTISINHNWFNGCNIHLCWDFLTANLAEVQREIADCQDMEGWADQCQLVLRASAGTNYTEVFRLLETIAGHRLQALHHRLSRRPGSGCMPRRPVVQGTQPSLRALYTPSPALKGRLHKTQAMDLGTSSVTVVKKADAASPQTASVGRGDTNGKTEGTSCSAGIAENGCCPPKDCDGKAKQELGGSILVEEMMKDDSLPGRTETVQESVKKICSVELVQDSSMLERVRKGEKAPTEELVKHGSLPEKAKTLQESGEETCAEDHVKCGFLPEKVSHAGQEKEGGILDFRHRYRGDPSRVKSVHWGRCSASHAVFDLLQVQAVLEEMSEDREFAHLGLDSQTLLSAIQDAVKEFESEGC